MHQGTIRGDHLVLGPELELVGHELRTAIGHLPGFPVQVRLNVVGYHHLGTLAHGFSPWLLLHR